jgi:hypothetical protein
VPFTSADPASPGYGGERDGHVRRVSLSAPRGGAVGDRARGCADAETGMLSTEVSSAICVQRFDDSRNSAIHTTYRISLRSSSMREPRYPLLRVVICFGAALSRRPGFSSECGLGVGETGGGQDGDASPTPHQRPVRARRRFVFGVEGHPAPLVPHPPARGSDECFPALRQSLVGACRRTRTFGSLWGC